MDSSSNDVASDSQLGSRLETDEPRQSGKNDGADNYSDKIVAATSALQLDERKENRQQHVNPIEPKKRVSPQSVRHVRPRINASLGVRYEWS